MAIQVINVGSSANSGGGDPLRSAMIKINENFTELYRRTGGEQAQTIIGADSTVLVDGPNSSLNANALSGTVPTDLISFSDLANPPDTIAGFGITDAYTKIQVYTKPEVDTLLEGPRDIKGTVVGDDSTVLIDGVNSTINAAALTGALPAIDGSALTGITATANNLVGDMKGSVYADDSTLLVDGVNGTLNSSALTKPIALADDEKTIFGAGDDLQIWHNGANSIIQNSTGELQLRGNTIRLLNAATTKDFAFFNNVGSVDLYYDGTKKFETTSDGISVTDHIALADDGELRLGTDNDMQIYHSGTAGFVKNTTGTLILQGSTVRIQDAGSSQTAFSAADGIATLLFENSAKLATSTDGVAVTGRITGLTDPTAAQDAATKAYVDASIISGGGGGGAAFTNIGVGADDSAIKSIGEGESFLILGGTGITTASDAEGNITITGFDGAFGSLSGKPTTLAGYGITDAASLNNMAPTGAVDFTGATSIDFNTVTINNLEFADISSKPTTLAGYGITDANTNAVSAVTAADLDMGGNKVLFANVYSNLVDLPSASTYHGMFAHVHATGLAYFAHGGAWIPLASAATTLAGYGITDAFDGAFGSLSGTPTTLGGYGITDAATTGTETTFTKDVHFDRGVEEKFQTLTGQSGVVAHNWNDGHVFYHTTPAGDITANFINVNLTAEYSTNVTIIINQGATPYEVTAVQIGGAAQTINWQGGSAPTGTANGIDAFSFTILNDGGSYVVLGQMVDFT